MHAEWSAECGADDAVLVVPWSDPDGVAGFVDLRANPDAVEEIAEAEASPPLMQALRALNAIRSLVFTAKCDAWEMDADEVAQLRLELALDPAEEDAELASTGDEAVLRCGHASYIDIICRSRALFASFPRQEHLVRRVVRLATPLELPHAMLECVLRPAFVNLQEARQGYAISLYVKALGESPRMARTRWAVALCEAIALLRRREVFR